MRKENGVLRSVHVLVVLIGILLLTSSALGSALPTYSIVDLWEGESWQVSINNSGQIVGRTGDWHAVLWENGVATNLNSVGTLGEPWTGALGLNNRGQVVGYAVIPDSGTPPYYHAVMWEHTDITDLGTLFYGSSTAYGINARGQIAGSIGPSEFDADPVMWDNGVIISLDPDSVFSRGAALGINNRGQVVGYGNPYPSGLGPTYAYVWEHGTRTELPSLDQWGAVAYDINNSGSIVGWSGGQAVIWKDEIVTELGVEGVAYAINDRGYVVGESSSGWAFIWVRGTVMNLNSMIDASSGWTLDRALDINERGQIVGSGTFNGESHTFLLNPTVAKRRESPPVRSVR